MGSTNFWVKRKRTGLFINNRSSLELSIVESTYLTICKQEIAWHRLDDLEPASDNVISRGMSGLKLYMIAPFLA